MKTKIKKRSKLGLFLDHRGTSQVWLRNKLGKDLYNEMAVSRWCNGEAEPDSTTWLLIKDALGCKLDEIK